MTADLLLALDQGTSSTRAVAFDADGGIVAEDARPLKQHYPRPGWVEHDAGEIWRAALEVCRAVTEKTGLARIAALGITNQRETAVIWDRATGEPIHNAIVWQDRRTADLCEELRAEGWAEKIERRTGLVPDPYFSATKYAWMLNTVEGARARAQKGELACGTIESWLVWNLTGGALHISDASNAARTLLWDITAQSWDEELLARLDLPSAMLPKVVDCAGALGETAGDVFGAEIAITGLAGDQQAASVGQACFQPGTMKATYGTGCFVLVNTGADKLRSAHKLLATTAYRYGGAHAFALEGSIFMAGAIMQWLRDELGIIGDVRETETLARQADPNSGVVMIPAFTGLGAPHWVADARAAITGLTRGSGRAEIVRAALEAVAFQSDDLMSAIRDDLGGAGIASPELFRIDGGMARNDWFAQFLADILDMPVERAPVTETTALGAAYLAGLGAGLYGSFEDIASRRKAGTRFEPKMAASERNARRGHWARALQNALAAAS